MDTSHAPTRRTRTAHAAQRLLTGQQAEREYGIPYRSLYDQITRGALACIRLPGSRRIWIDRRDLEALIEQSRERRDV